MPDDRAIPTRVPEVRKGKANVYHGLSQEPRHRKQAGVHDPEFELPSSGWRRASASRKRSDDKRIRRGPAACSSSRGAPGTTDFRARFQTFRLAHLTREVRVGGRLQCDFLDLSLLTAQYGRQILPCKACVSTAMPLCHWPCSCYPNHAMGQVVDWMNELYPRWVAAHGVMIVTPVYWYQAPSVLKLMMDRLVCADGGNPDPTTTRGKNPAAAKALGSISTCE